MKEMEKEKKSERKNFFVDCCQLSSCRNEGNRLVCGNEEEEIDTDTICERLRQVRMILSFMFLFGSIVSLCACGSNNSKTQNLCADQHRKKV